MIARLGQKPNRLKPVSYATPRRKPPAAMRPPPTRMSAMELKGIDVFVYWPSRNPNELADAVGKLAGDGLSLQMIDNRGVKVWPAGRAETFCTDSFRCRFMSDGTTDMGKLLDVAQRIADAGIDIAMTADAAHLRRPGRLHAGTGAISHMAATPLVAVIMGSKSDWETMRQADEMLTKFDVPHECRVLSAHRTPAETAEYVCGAEVARHRSDHRGGGRRGAPGGRLRRPHRPAGARRAHGERGAEGHGLAALHRADARRNSGGHAGHRAGRRAQRRAAGRRDPGHQPARAP